MKRPRRSKFKSAFIAATATFFGFGGIAGLEQVPDENDRIDATFSTVNEAGIEEGININPSDQLWKASLIVQSQDKLNESLLESVRNEDSWRVKAALDAGADVNSNDGLAVRLALRSGDTYLVDAMADSGIDMTTMGARYGYLETILKGDLSLAMKMVDMGMDVHEWEDGLLKAAVHENDINTLNQLLDRHTFSAEAVGIGAAMAADAGHNDIERTLMGYPARQPDKVTAAMIQSAKMGNETLVSYFHFLGGDLEANNNAALKNAIAWHDTSMVKHMISLGVDVTTNDHEPLYIAVDTNNLETTEALLQAGANPDARNGAIKSNAARWGSTQMQDLLNKYSPPNLDNMDADNTNRTRAQMGPWPYWN